MKLTLKELNILTMGHNTCLVIPVPLSEAENVVKLKSKLDEGKTLTMELKPLSEGRTLSANGYCWALCNEIAIELSKNKDYNNKEENTYVSKEDVYRNAIRDCGVFKHIGFASEEAMKQFAVMWKRNGTGWVTEEIGHNELLVYFGSSTYDKKQMARLIDCLLNEAKEQGVQIKASNEIDKMIDEWGSKYG